MGLFDSFTDSSSPKLWSIGKHRVQKKKKTIPGTAPLGVPDGDLSRKKTYYMCVDCEKDFDSRESFKSEECYEVIENGT